MSNINNKLLHLSEEKKLLLKKQIQKQLENSKKKIVPLLRTNNQYSLSLRQQRLFILDQIDQGNPFYNIPACLNFKGDLKIRKLEKAINSLIQQHYSLRTTFKVDEYGIPHQYVNDFTPFTLEVINYKNQNQTKDEVIREIVQTSFFLKEGPLWRISLLKEDEQENLLIISFHHILFDGWSLEVFIKELCIIYQRLNYESEDALIQPLDIQYVDYAEWERNYFNQDRMKEQLAYWENELKGCTDILSLPTDKIRPVTQSYKGSLYTIDLPKDIHTKLKNVCKMQQTTLFMITLAAFQTLLSRYSNQDDVIVGFPISCRDQDEVESLIGLFVNTLPLRADMSNNPTFIELLEQVKGKSLEAFNNKHIPFDLLVEHLQPSRNLSFNPIFQVLFSYQNAILPISMDGLTVEFENIDPGTSKFDLSLDIFEGTDEIPPKLAFEYNNDLFYEETVKQIAKHYIYILQQISEEPSQRIGELSLLSAKEQIERLRLSTKEEYTLETSIVSLFEQRVLKANQLTAVSHLNKSYTYYEVNRRANVLARYFREQGVKPYDFIGISLNKSIDMVVSVLAVLKLGATYIPIDPHYPKARQLFMIKDSKVNLLITTSDIDIEETAIQRVIKLDLISKSVV